MKPSTGFARRSALRISAQNPTALSPYFLVTRSEIGWKYAPRTRGSLDIASDIGMAGVPATLSI